LSSRNAYTLHGAFTHHQLVALAHAADRLLALLGFSDVKRDGETITSASADQTPG
jgi:hypothetical protein